MLCKMKELLDIAEKDKKAIGAFNVGNMEMVIGAVKAAEEKNTPIIIQIAEKRLADSPLSYIGPMMVQAAREAKVKISVNLDHGISVQCIKQALELGFTSVMYDGSDYDIETNIKNTLEIKKMASYYGANVEAELGILGGNEGNGEKQMRYTDCKSAEYFCDRTGVDALAISIGNAHGHYKEKPDLRLDVLKDIDSKVRTPLVLHGGTGISDDDFRRSIDFGIRKINIATSNLDSVVIAGNDYFQLNNKEDYNYFIFSRAIVNGMSDNVKKYIDIFNNGVM